jgi:murein L,D-transpeptidase YcbB/YkuD
VVIAAAWAGGWLQAGPRSASSDASDTELRARVDAMDRRMNAVLEKLDLLVAEVGSVREELGRQEPGAGATARAGEGTTGPDAGQEASDASADELEDEAEIEEENAAQAAYVDRVAEIFRSRQANEEWSDRVTENSLRAMNALEYAQARTAENSDASETADVAAAMTQFRCRDQLCEAEFVAASLRDLVAYQHQMVDRLRSDLPKIVFDVPVETGGQFRMRVYLAGDDYEFPDPGTDVPLARGGPSR